MTERITNAVDASRDDAIATLELSLQDLMDGGVDEDLARASLNIGTDRAIKGQQDKFAKDPEAYLFYRDGTNALKALLKTTAWYRGDRKNYSANSFDTLVTKLELATIGNRFSKPRLGYQALVAASDVNRDYVISSLIATMLDGRDELDRRKEIIVPLHENDPAKMSAVGHGFNPTGLEAEMVDLFVEHQVVTVPMKQELYVRKER